MKKFDLFKLHSKEDKPNGWIWVYLDSGILRKNYLELLNSKYQDDVAREISNKLNCGFSTIVKHLIRLRHPKKYIELPLPVIIELVNLIDIKLKNKIIENFEYFICKSSTTRQTTKALKSVNINLAKLIGAHLADGHSQKESNTYKLKICDGREDLVEICAKWIKAIFEFNAIIRLNKGDNTYNCCFNNKIIGRYFEKIFDIKAGKKFDIAKEPIIIKNSNFEIRKAFASGVLSFDGGIDCAGIIGLSSKSKELIDDIYEILKLDGINVNKRSYKNKTWHIESKSGRNKKYLKKWLDYFEPETWKYNRLKFFLEDKKYNINELKYLFPKHYLSKISLNDIYNSIRTLKLGKINNIILELKRRNLKVANTTVYKYLYLLEKSGLIYKELEEHITDKNGWWESVYYLS